MSFQLELEIVHIFFLVHGKDVWNDGGIKDFKLSVKGDGGQFTEVDIVPETVIGSPISLDALTRLFLISYQTNRGDQKIFTPSILTQYWQEELNSL